MAGPLRGTQVYETQESGTTVTFTVSLAPYVGTGGDAEVYAWSCTDVEGGCTPSYAGAAVSFDTSLCSTTALSRVECAVSVTVRCIPLTPPPDPLPSRRPPSRRQRESRMGEWGSGAGDGVRKGLGTPGPLEGARG